MKSEKAKWIILIILIVIAAVVWMRNLRIFGSKETYYQTTKAEHREVNAGSGAVSRLEYKKPRLNPFVLPPSPKVQQAVSAAPKKRQSPAPQKISTNYKIDGIVIEAENPQAVLTSGDGSNIMITLNDFIDGWLVEEIIHDRIIFSQNKFRDTLWLMNSLSEDQK